MIAALSLTVFVVLFLLVSWVTRNARSKPSCCRPGQWPPDDITSRSR